MRIFLFYDRNIFYNSECFVYRIMNAFVVNERAFYLADMFPAFHFLARMHDHEMQFNINFYLIFYNTRVSPGFIWHKLSVSNINLNTRNTVLYRIVLMKEFFFRLC